MKAANPAPKYTTEQLEEMAEKLRALPEPEKKKQEHTKQDAIKVLVKDISALQKKGYTIEQIAESLSGVGLDISTPTLRNYMTRANASKSTPKKRGAKKADKKSESETPETPVAHKTFDESNATFTIREDKDE